MSSFPLSQTTTATTTSPKVIIAGGGPAGLLAAILLGIRAPAVPIVVLERASAPDAWSTKSYSIVLGERGTRALDFNLNDDNEQQPDHGTTGSADGDDDATKNNVLAMVRAQGMPRNFVIMHSPTTTGEQPTAIPKKTPGIGFSRPLLVQCLENIITTRIPSVTIQRGVSVSGLVFASKEEEKDDLLHVSLDNGSTVTGTHVIAADGKWSNVRRSVPEWRTQARMRTLPTFGVHLIVPTVPQGWQTNGTHVIRPKASCDGGQAEGLFYIIAAPIPSGELSVSIVCYDETAERYPWLLPEDAAPDDSAAANDQPYGWEDDYSAMPPAATEAAGASTTAASSSAFNLADKLEELLEREVPAFLSAIGRDALATARINRRVTWLEMGSSSSAASTTTGANDTTAGSDGTAKKPAVPSSCCYATRSGRIALIGDAAHAMAPTMGEGCNTALESAAKLVDSLVTTTTLGDESSERTSTSTTKNSITVEDLSKAFLAYGRSRPSEVQPIQITSAERAKWTPPRGSSVKK